MPDITMCMNKICLQRFHCYRFVATPTEGRQSCADFQPDEKGECEDYWPVDGKEFSNADT